MREALEALPWVEKGSVKVDMGQKLVAFRVTDPKDFKKEDVLKAVEGAGFKATLAKTGSGIQA